jgi:hypothetical protein
MTLRNEKRRGNGDVVGPEAGLDVFEGKAIRFRRFLVLPGLSVRYFWEYERLVGAVPIAAPVLEQHTPAVPIADYRGTARTDASRVVRRVRNYDLLVSGVFALGDAVEDNAIIGNLRFAASGRPRQRDANIREREDQAFEILFDVLEGSVWNNRRPAACSFTPAIVYLKYSKP